MSKRKPRNEGPAYCDYQDLFDSITIELENIYHTFWDKRKEAPKFLEVRNIGVVRVKVCNTPTNLKKGARNTSYM